MLSESYSYQLEWKEKFQSNKPYDDTAVKIMNGS
jgi:hypothetical protein